MKKLHLLSTVALFFAVFNFSSCSSEFEPIDSAIVIPDPEDPGNPGPGDPAVFKVDFDGQTYTATVTQAVINSSAISITALRGTNGEMFQLTIPNGTIGTYTWDSVWPTSVIAMAYSPSTGADAYIGAMDDEGEFADFPGYVDTAEIKILSINTTTQRIKGTFKFTGVRFADDTGDTILTKVFTNGQFDIPYTGDVVVGPGTNTFSAKLDGAVFTPTNILAVANSGIIQIIGRRGDIENISINVPATVTPGTYNLDMFGDYVGLYIANATPQGTFGANGGTVTIVSHNATTGQIKGTFNFTCSSSSAPGTHNITEGNFDVDYN